MDRYKKMCALNRCKRIFKLLQDMNCLPFLNIVEAIVDVYFQNYKLFQSL